MTPALLNKKKAFTRIELLIIIAMVGVIVCLLLPALSAAKVHARQMKCTNNLKMIGLAFRTWATDNMDGFPMTYSTNQRGSKEWIEMKANGAKYLYMTFRCLSNELGTPNLLICPSDNKKAATNWDEALISGKKGSGNGALSYGLGLHAQETYPKMLLAMDRNITNGASIDGVNILPDQPAAQWGNLGTNQPTVGGGGWSYSRSHWNFGQAAMGDGSVECLDSARLRELLRKTEDPNTLKNEFEIPGNGLNP